MLRVLISQPFSKISNSWAQMVICVNVCAMGSEAKKDQVSTQLWAARFPTKRGGDEGGPSNSLLIVSVVGILFYTSDSSITPIVSSGAGMVSATFLVV